ncbi:rhodanese-like domain-containing protein [Gracilimonas halophila]|uniref:Rhodanese-like domain-containing protein n=2 Tax=Gracilimonas halophila TaxID=1834464 RepID=A0ABW5JI43_9BACT|eukprot:GDKH01007828.1.p1 GENE.GDKH01007828.1~~GDKH01007828.1.p1  ORF type:complete len:137 (-),score=10.57 GDKH01007828.1:201-611(-)
MWKTIVITATLLILGIIMFNIFNKTNTEKETTMSIDISTEEFKEKRAETEGIVIDVRTKDEYDEGHLAETDHQFDLMNGEFQSQLESLSKEETYYLYCRSGNRSGQAARIMKNAGFENVYNVGGFEDLARAGFETE